MSYKVYAWGPLTAIEWSQAVWKVHGAVESEQECADELVYDVLMKYVPRDGLTVEAGCGTGKWPIYFRRLGYRILGIEISHEAGAIARSNEPGLGIVQGDVRHVPVKAHSVDTVLSLGVVEHDEAGPMEALREAHRILKPDGTLILAVPYNNLFRRCIVNPLQTYVTWKRRRAQAVLRFAEYRFSKREMKDFLERTGFEVAHMSPNDWRPPRNAGLWVDYQGLTFNALAPRPAELFILPGIKGQIAAALMRWVPWLVCAEVVYVARPRVGAQV